MKIKLYLLALLLFLVSCKKDAVDGSSTKNFQSSINDMQSSLNTLEQTKFNEALYVLKTFGVDAEGDVDELKALAKLIDGKKVPEIFAMADEVAKKNNIDWTSTGPPSLGEMNIFQNISATESDPNDISANGVNLFIKPVSVDSLVGPRAMMVVPRLVDGTGKEVEFSNAGLETILEVYSQGVKLLTSKNLMSNNNFKGFYLKFSSLPKEKILDNKVDIKVSVRTSKKTFSMTKTGVEVNGNAMVETPKADTPTTTEGENPIPDATTPTEGATSATPDNTTDKPAETEKPKPAGDPKQTVSKFLNNLSAQNLRGAYSVSENPNWGSYDSFANPTSGFGAIKGVSVKSVNTKANANQTASVNASYQVTDKDGNKILVDATYGLKQTSTGWKITSYRINSSQKQ